jgi:hypothetical protein
MKRDEINRFLLFPSGCKQQYQKDIKQSRPVDDLNENRTTIHLIFDKLQSKLLLVVLTSTLPIVIRIEPLVFILLSLPLSELCLRDTNLDSGLDNGPTSVLGVLTSLDLGHLPPFRTCGSGAGGMSSRSPTMLEPFSVSPMALESLWFSPAADAAEIELDMTVGFLMARCFCPSLSQALKVICRAAVTSFFSLRNVVAVEILPVMLPPDSCCGLFLFER